MIGICGGVHWRLVELNVDHACGLISLLKVIGGRLGITDIPDFVDVMVHGPAEPVKEVLGSSIVIEQSLVPNLASRAILIGGVPYASLEDLVVSVVVNEEPWYVGIIREILGRDSVRRNLRWEWINEVLSRYGAGDRFQRLTGRHQL
jgi:hypothetical protein